MFDATTVLLASQSVLLGAAAIAILRFQARCRSLEDFWSSPTAARLVEDDHEISHKEAESRIISVQTEQALLEKLKLDQRISDLQRRLREIGERDRKNSAPIAVEIERHLPIENALRMAKNGASVDELTRVCGLNVGEAQLLRRLHGKSSVSMSADHN